MKEKFGHVYNDEILKDVVELSVLYVSWVLNAWEGSMKIFDLKRSRRGQVDVKSRWKEYFDSILNMENYGEAERSCS